MSWVPLHVHSQYSILDSTISIKALAKKAQEMEFSSVALTDSGNMHGVVEFYKTLRGKGIKPIIGCELSMAPTSRHEKKKIVKRATSYPLILLVKDKNGYQNLCQLSSIGYIEGFYYRPRIDKEVLEKYREGLICLSGPYHAFIAQSIIQGEEEEAEQEVLWLRQIFGDDFYLELQRHPMTEAHLQKDGMTKEPWRMQRYQEFIQKQDLVNQYLGTLSQKYSIPCVATNDAHYLEREDFYGHEILLNVASGETCEIWERDSQGKPLRLIPNPKRKTYASHEFYCKSSQEMQELFADCPEALAVSVAIAQKCNFEFDFSKKHYPSYALPDEENSTGTKQERKKRVEDHLHTLCKNALPLRYKEKDLQEIARQYPDKDPKRVIEERVEYEFHIISSKGMCDYLLIVYDFIAWAKKNNIPVGPGRGSAAGSILCYLLGITDIEPLRFHLFFERFINPERLSYPDIDVDICMDRRQEVIDYTIAKYGKDRVAQIITFGTMKAKMAIRDVGRVLNIPLSKVNAIAKLVPEDPTITLEKALKLDPELKELYERDHEAKRILDVAKAIEGSIRNTSTHAAGVIISANPITEHVPVCFAKDADMVVTQYSMKPVEQVGMLKIDFLGLKTLTSIQQAVHFIEKNTRQQIDWNRLPLDDPDTFALLNQGKTSGVFQLESAGMQELAKQLHIDRFEEIIAVGALYRPGPMDMIPSFIQRKHKREKIEIEHPLMHDILEETYGVMVYQEQVMQIASVLAGYSLGEGDVLRRAIGKKDRKEMLLQREKFMQGALKHDIAEDVAGAIFDKIEKFASYGFNKSHAAAYAYLSYVTAYLKAHYPHEWMAALLTCDRDDISKVAKYIRECRSLGIAILPPDINEATLEFSPTKEGIRFAMTAIKGMGEGIVESIMKKRQEHGPFSSLYDFISHVDTTTIGKKAIELLIDAGAFDATQWSRDQLRESVDAMYEEVSRQQQESSQGVLNFFSLLDQKDRFTEPPQVVHATREVDKLRREKELLGFYLTGHPMKAYEKILKKLSCIPLKEIEKCPLDNAVVRVAFVIDEVKFKIASKTQKKFAIITISDGEERLELPVWSDLYEEVAPLLTENSLLYGIIQMERKDHHLRLNVRRLFDLTKIDDAMIPQLEGFVDKLKEVPLRKKNFTASQKELGPALLHLKINADAISFSHILLLKKLFRSHPGQTEVTLSYFAGQKSIGTIHIGKDWGVAVQEDLQRKILEIPGIEEVRAQ
ncbi:MAG: DNA polymerase III subunit alpha [Parachlamydiales bacterium]|nr:DNA polymerase III subunit alpha [Parachlamydiales bacterium]